MVIQLPLYKFKALGEYKILSSDDTMIISDIVHI